MSNSENVDKARINAFTYRTLGSSANLGTAEQDRENLLEEIDSLSTALDAYRGEIPGGPFYADLTNVAAIAGVLATPSGRGDTVSSLEHHLDWALSAVTKQANAIQKMVALVCDPKSDQDILLAGFREILDIRTGDLSEAFAPGVDTQ